VIIRYKPGWTVPLFRVAANELTDRIVPLDALWGHEGASFYERLVETENVTELLACVSGVLARARRFESSSAHLARRAARLLDAGEARIDRVAARLGITDRHLRRAFTEHVGVGPKDYARSVRLQRAVRLAATSNDWGRIALDAGYYDQAHFIADFRQLVGVTPRTFAGGAREADLPCA
jgi:AraC-like DNA-binding protein